MVLRILSLFLLLSSQSSLAQLPFQMNQLTSSIEGSAEEQYLIATAQINNMTDSTIVIAWQRITEEVPENWITYICSNITCAPPDVSMGMFSLTANDSTNLDIYFLPKETGGLGKVELKLFTFEDTATSLVIEYFGNASPVNTQELTTPTVELFPNPSTDYLHWSTHESFSQYRILNLQGQIVQKGSLTDSSLFVGDLSTGHYYLQLWDHNRQPIHLGTFQKIE